MTRYIVTDEQKIIFQGRQHELTIRFLKGVLDPGLVNSSLQIIIEGGGMGFYQDHYPEIISDWQNFWHKITGQEYDFSKIHIPAKPEGKWRLLICIDISLEKLYAECKKRFPCWSWTDKNFDETVIQNERNAKTSPYAIWAKDEKEADENLKNLSANDIKAKKMTTETLAERLIHELEFFDETGQHLDIKNVTLCSGSRCDDGGVPYARWNSRCSEMDVYWRSAGYSSGGLRARQAVSI